ncbi:MAG: putative metal-binding motif-containing protein [Myxococcota bacterium]
MWIFPWLACTGGPPTDPDVDRDGWPASVDCDDSDPFVHPGASEFCDGRDDDCDGEVDRPDPLGTWAWYPDADGDRFGDPSAAPQIGCDPGPGWSTQAADCDDSDPTRYPGRLDGCNGRDDDCDDAIDEDPGVRYRDADADGFGDREVRWPTCDGSTVSSDDCDDADPGVHPGAPEACDGRDGDCDGFGDDLDATTETFVWYPDADRDGFGLDLGSVEACVPPSDAFAVAAGDCDDLDPETHPGAVQRCVAADTDCDGAPGDSTGWWDPAWPHRIPLTVTGASAGVPAEIEIDFAFVAGALGETAPLDPASVVVVVQDCAGAGAEPLPTAFVDGLWTATGPGDPSDALGDEDGLVTFVPTDGRSQLAVYFSVLGESGGPASPAGGAAWADATGLGSGVVEVTLDATRAGVADRVSVGGVEVASQADARAGNGVERQGQWTVLRDVTPVVLSAGPAFAAVAVDGEHTGSSGTIRYRWWWTTWTGSPVVWGRVTIDAVTDLYWDHLGDYREAIRPFEAVPVGLGPLTTSTEDGFASATDGAFGFGVGWVDPPLDPFATSCDPTSCRLAGAEGQGSWAFVGAGTRLVDHRVLALAPFAGGELPAEALEAALASPPVVSLGAPESL